VTLAGSNSYGGQTSVQAGRLILAGNGARTTIFLGTGSSGADITGGRLIFDYNTGTNPATQGNSALAAGFSQLPTKFATGALRTSNATNGNKALGWYDDASSKQVSVLYTFYGDANCDGAVNGLDFNALASNFGGLAKFWYQGDFNYDGTVN